MPRQPWPKLSKDKQNDIIDRLRGRVGNAVKMAVHLIASEGRTVVVGDLDQITIKDGVKAVVKFGASPGQEFDKESFNGWICRAGCASGARAEA